MNQKRPMSLRLYVQLGSVLVAAHCIWTSIAVGQPCDCSDGSLGNEWVATAGDISDLARSGAPGSLGSIATTDPSLAFTEQSAAFAGPTFASNAGYVEYALIRNMVRLRFDAAYDFNRPDRAEFFYTTWEARGGKNPNPGTPPPVGPGFPDPEIDRQELSLYVERAFGNDFSAFVRLPVVFSNPLHNPNDVGFGDVQAGIKLALWQDSNQVLTFRLNNFIPTADAAHSWVGTGHYSIEPGLLHYARLTERWTLESEVRDWISIGGAKNPLPNLDGSAAGSDYAGNVLRFGVALGYNLVQGCRYRLTPVVETVGWSVLEGQVFDFNDQLVVPGRPDTPNSGAALDSVDADGDTIVNLKIGVRVADYRGTGLYGGWGRSLTGDRWYRDIFRFEIRRSF